MTRALVFGASGYVGTNLVPRLVAHGSTVRAAARRRAALEARGWPDVDLVAADALVPDSLPAALEEIDVAYYLVHSMAAGSDFPRLDRAAAENFRDAAARAGVKRIVYLGGLQPPGETSAHLASRSETGAILREGSVPVTEVRAGVIIGPGSAAFEVIRDLVFHLPAMVTPRWVRVPAQPIAINDVLAYLEAALDLEQDGPAIFEIGGPEALAYGDLMREYARQRGLRRAMIPVPLLTPHLSSLWLGLVTPVYARIGRKLIDGIRNPTLVRDRSALERFAVRPVGVREAIAQAIRNEDREFAETHWTGAVSATCAPRPWGGVRTGNRLFDTRTVGVDVPPARAFRPIQRIGGKTGWYYGNGLWRLRGGLDLLAGGVGLRRGRRHPVEVRSGDALDFWRVEVFEPDRRLRLLAEMKLPGRAWLEFTVEPDGAGARITQTAVFDPLGLAGLAYWYGAWPLHQMVFAGMLRNLARAARQNSLP